MERATKGHMYIDPGRYVSMLIKSLSTLLRRGFCRTPREDVILSPFCHHLSLGDMVVLTIINLFSDIHLWRATAEKGGCTHEAPPVASASYLVSRQLMIRPTNVDCCINALLPILQEREG